MFSGKVNPKLYRILACCTSRQWLLGLSDTPSISEGLVRQIVPDRISKLPPRKWYAEALLLVITSLPINQQCNVNGFLDCQIPQASLKALSAKYSPFH
jgi:hypothetical protein